MKEERTMSKVTVEELELVHGLIAMCIKHLSKKEYQLNLPKTAVQTALDVLEVKKRKGTPSRAGSHLIRINLEYWQMNKPVAIEYAKYNNDPVIGQINVNRKFDQLLVMIAHEVSHHIQFRYGFYVDRYRSTYRKPHGYCFQSIYRYLRRDLVNPMIEQELKMAA
jgi:hypothetical protein